MAPLRVLKTCPARTARPAKHAGEPGPRGSRMREPRPRACGARVRLASARRATRIAGHEAKGRLPPWRKVRQRSTLPRPWLGACKGSCGLQRLLLRHRSLPGQGPFWRASRDESSEAQVLHEVAQRHPIVRHCFAPISGHIQASEHAV